MRADHAVRHNAAVGALVGLAVGDALGQRDVTPPAICGGEAPTQVWARAAATAFENAEAHLNGEPLDIAASPTGVLAVAIALADPDTPPPLLADPDSALICESVRAGLLGTLALDPALASDHGVRAALTAVDEASDYSEAVTASAAPLRPLVGALAGLCWGPAAIPSAWATTITGNVGARTYGLRQLRRLAERLMQQDAPVPPEPRRSLGPREVAPGLWLSNLHAVPSFLNQHPEGAVVSLCPTTGAFDNHMIRREFALHDAAGSKVNPRLSQTVDEVLSTVAAFRAEERPVLVHCHHGASRTGLILRAWLVDELGLSYDDATTEAQVRWSKTSTWNNAFCKEIRRRCAEAE